MKPADSKTGTYKKSGHLSLLFLIQGVYYLLTGFWPILDIESFMAVTGPKTEIWLVKTVGMVIVIAGAGFTITGILRSVNFPLLVMAIGYIFGFILVDVIYVFQGLIPEIYLLDALLQAVLLIFWVVAFHTVFSKSTS